MEQGLKELAELVAALKATTKSSEKVRLLREAPESVHRWLVLTYDKINYTFHVTSEKVITQTPCMDGGSLHCLLSFLSEKGSASHADAAWLCGVMELLESLGADYDLLCNIIDRDLGCGISAKTINKAIPNLVPVFDVALGEPIKKYKTVNGERVLVDNTPADLFDGNWLVSRKLDGIRCVVEVHNGRAICRSRQGKVFHTTKLLEEALQDFEGLVFDGELCIVDENGNEDFKAITKEYSRKNHTLTNFKYLVFDVLTREEFYGQEESPSFYDRVRSIREVCEVVDSPHVDNVSQGCLRSEKQYKLWEDDVRTEGWEGLILRKDVPYKGRRSKDILKVKNFEEEEFKITGYGIGPFSIRQGGKESVIQTVVSISVEKDDIKSDVGSGFTLEEREGIKNNPNKYLGKQATIRYFETSEDEQGNTSLRFPVYKGLREKGV